MKILIIGSTQYFEKISNHKERLVKDGHDVKIPALDLHPELDELAVCENNREAILWADEIHLIWDRRSTGVIFDFGMTFMARKRLKIIYLESKTFEGVMRKYSDSTMV